MSPVVYIHGFGGSPATLAWMAHKVGRPAIFFRWSSLGGEVPAAARRLAELVQEPVDLVGFSLGAVVGRTFLKMEGGYRWVRSFVSVAGPHGGTPLHELVPTGARKVLDPSSPLLRRLNLAGEPVPTTCVFSEDDEQVPAESAAIPGARHVRLRGISHNGMLVRQPAWEAVRDALAAAERDERHPEL